jgi:hypothetical protein
MCAAMEMSASSIASTKTNRNERAISPVCTKKVWDILVMKSIEKLFEDSVEASSRPSSILSSI